MASVRAVVLQPGRARHSVRAAPTNVRPTLPQFRRGCIVSTNQTVHMAAAGSLANLLRGPQRRQ